MKKAFKSSRPVSISIDVLLKSHPNTGSEMADLQQMGRILYHHNWVRVEDWASNLQQLADLTDEQIVQLESFWRKEGSRPNS